MEESRSHAVIVSNVHREFRIGEITVHALRGTNMEVSEGEFVIVLDPSGSGKSTLLNQIGGIDSPTKCSVKIHGENITDWRGGKLSEYRRNKVGWIFQFFNLIPSLRAWENVALALEFKGESKRDI
ncbi:MAG: ATP-binding cassette domain-containing protein [Promethearchaeota archaeon]